MDGQKLKLDVRAQKAYEIDSDHYLAIEKHKITTQKEDKKKQVKGETQGQGTVLKMKLPTSIMRCWKNNLK